jgi:ribosomal protein S18 acetylase RimI-like enzyme
MSESLEEKYLDLNDFEEEIVRIQSLPGAVMLVAEIEEKPAAYVIVKPRRPARLKHTADLNMGVARSARGQGIGGLILQAGLEKAALSELEVVYLTVRLDNIPALKLYKRMGFETLTILHRDLKIDGRYFDGLLMRRFLMKIP